MAKTCHTHTQWEGALPLLSLSPSLPREASLYLINENEKAYNSALSSPASLPFTFLLQDFSHLPKRRRGDFH